LLLLSIPQSPDIAALKNPDVDIPAAVFVFLAAAAGAWVVAVSFRARADRFGRFHGGTTG
jgi:hypothetical protein